MKTCLEPLYVDTTPIHGIAGRDVRRVKEGTSTTVPEQSRLDEQRWADAMELYGSLRNIQDLLADGKTPHERRFGEHFGGLVTPFGATIEDHSITANDKARLYQFGKKAFPTCATCGEKLEEAYSKQCL